MREYIVFIMLCAQLAWLSSTLDCRCKGGNKAAGGKGGNKGGKGERGEADGVARAAAFGFSAASVALAAGLLFHSEATLCGAVAVAALMASLSCGWYTLELTSPRACGCRPAAWLGYAAASASFVACLLTTSCFAYERPWEEDGSLKDMSSTRWPGFAEAQLAMERQPLSSDGLTSGYPNEGVQTVLVVENVPRPRQMAQEVGIEVGAVATDGEIREMLQKWYREPPARAQQPPVVIIGGGHGAAMDSIDAIDAIDEQAYGGAKKGRRPHHRMCAFNSRTTAKPR